MRTGSPLVKLIGFPATLIHGDTLVLDRWLWLQHRLPRVLPGSLALLDVGCGQGAFTIGLALRGYKTLGLTWDELDQRKAQERAGICKAELANFEKQDVRTLDERDDLVAQFDVVMCMEVIEHVIDDRKLMHALGRCLKPGGRLLLTTPNFDYRPMTRADAGPFLAIEDGRHVRKGYTAEMLQALCADSGIVIDRVSFCSGFFSQKCTALLRSLSTVPYGVAWASVLPLRPLPLLFDRLLENTWPGYSICLEARKPVTV